MSPVPDAGETDFTGRSQHLFLSGLPGVMFADRVVA
jgi:hypothetical protein